MTIGDRVKIKSKNPYSKRPDNSPFAGCTGRVVGVEHDGQTRMYRVALDHPVIVPGVGTVSDDLWSGLWLRKIQRRG